MNILDELRHLRKMFPNARELAVSAEMAERFEAEMVIPMRYVAFKAYNVKEDRQVFYFGPHPLVIWHW